MTLSRKVELVGGVATGVLGLVVPFFPNGAHTLELIRLWPGLLLGDLVGFIIPGLLVAIGSYIHTLQGKTRGFVLLLVGGIFLTITMFIHIFGGVFYVYGLWGGGLILVQSSMALITVISSLIARRPTRES